MPNPINPAVYKIPTFHSAVASAALVAISAVAFGVLFALNGSVTSHMLQMCVVGGAGGFGLAGFALSVAATVHTHRKQKKLEAEARREQEHARAAEARRADACRAAELAAADAAEAGPDGVHPLTLTHMKAQAPRLLNAAKRAVTALNCAHGRATRTNHRQEETIEIAISDAEGVLLRNFDNRTFYLRELLCFFGRGKTIPSVTRRRLIAAHNCDSPKYDQIKDEWDALERGYNPTAVKDLFAPEDEDHAAILAGMPGALVQHFCLTDETLKDMGQDLLDKIFGENRLDTNTNVRAALADLKAARETPEFVDKMEEFVLLAFEKAQLSDAETRDLCDRLIAHMLDTQFKANVKNILGIVARNIRIIPLMLDRSAKKEQLFPQIDDTFLLSESHDCIEGERGELQKALVRLQSQINLERSPEEKIVFVVGEGEGADDIVRSCEGEVEIEAYMSQLNAIRAEHSNPRVRAVCIGISDHPFKRAHTVLAGFRPLINGLAGIGPVRSFAKRFALGEIESKLQQIFPTLEPDDQAILKEVASRLLDALMVPILDGAVKNSGPFKEPFGVIITREGERIADDLERLIDQEDITVDEIIQQAEAAIGSLAGAFQEVAVDG